MSDNTFSSLKNHFLLAMPGLQDPRFSHSVILICEHTPEGAMGLTINQPIDIPVSRIFDQFDLEYSEETGEAMLFSGGPVQIERGFVLHRPSNHQWETTRTISPEICLTASADIIADIARDRGPDHSMITLGYAGWGAGQLEHELAENSWLVTPADAGILFDLPFGERAKATAASIGIDLARLSSQAGHA